MGRLVLTTAIALVLCGFSEAQANPRPFEWVYWAGKQGAYQAAGNRQIRFINVEYRGPENAVLWNHCFNEAAQLYRRENITFPMGGNNNFFEVGGLSNSVKRIVGWTDDTTGQGAYIVITDIQGGAVNYYRNDGQAFVIGGNPGNFEDWRIGHQNGDWGPGITSLVSIQLWKHLGGNGPNAGVAFWLRQVGRI
jgi:hypothetical protein